MSLNNIGKNLEKQNQNKIFEDEKNEIKIDIEDILDFQKYKNLFEEIIPELKKFGLIIDENGFFDLSNLSGDWRYIKIIGKNFENFPSCSFNKKYNIGNKKGLIFSKEKLKNFLKFFNFKVLENTKKIKSKISTVSLISKEEYKEHINQIIPELKKIGLIIDENGFLDLTNLTGDWKYIKINGKNLSSFPNSDFNKKNNIGNTRGKIQRIKDLQVFLNFIGFKTKFLKENIYENIEKAISKSTNKYELRKILIELIKIGLVIDNKGVIHLNNFKGKVYISGKLQSLDDIEDFFKTRGISVSRKTHITKELKKLIPFFKKKGLSVTLKGDLDFSNFKGDILLNNILYGKKDLEDLFKNNGFRLKKED